MRENGLMTCSMDLVKNLGTVERLDSKVTTKRVEKKVKANTNGLMDLSMRVILLTANFKDLVFITQLKVRKLMKDLLYKISLKEKVNYLLKMADATRAISKLIKKMVKALCCMPMETSS